MDSILQNAQWQCHISFYMTCRSEESTHIGSASTLQSQDTIFAQYQEQGRGSLLSPLATPLPQA
eukprot:9866189-Ditylum_brightwellii.AAC.1